MFINALIATITMFFKKIAVDHQPPIVNSLITLSSFFNNFQHITVLSPIKYDKFFLIRFLQMGDFFDETKNCDSSRNLD